MRTSTFFLLFILQSSFHGLIASEPPIGEMSRAILVLFNNEEHKPELKMRPSSNSLVIHYQTREFLVHGKSMTGKITEKAHKTIGPSYKGLIIETGDVIQAATPQVIKDPYWSTYINRLNFENYSLFYGVKYGSRTNMKLKQSIIDKLNSWPGQVSQSR